VTPAEFVALPIGVATAKRGLNWEPALGFVLGDPAADTFEEYTSVA